MKTKIKYIALTLLIGFSYGCFKDNDDNATGSSSVKDFVWKAMNSVYLYNANVPDLADDRFITFTSSKLDNLTVSFIQGPDSRKVLSIYLNIQTSLVAK